MPGLYGHSAETFTVGEGRLARPRFRFTGNISVGYDDNVFQTPTHPQGVPARTVEVLQQPAIPSFEEEELVPSGDPTIPASVQPVRIPATAPVFRAFSLPAVPAAERISSWVTRTDAKWDVQFANRLTLFTFDLGAGVDYYWERPGEKDEYRGNLALIYLRKLSGRAQFTMNVTASYQSQPDFSAPNAPTSNTIGPYMMANAKADLSYRLTPRFSTVTSVNYNTLTYEDSTNTGSDFADATFGIQLRYLFSPRLTFTGELRYSTNDHPNSPTLDTTSYFVLVGGDLTLSRRFNASLRVGEEVRTFAVDGQTAGAPHLEAALNYRFGEGTSVQWNALYGYEESGSPNARSLVARSGLQLMQVFTPRFQGSFGLNLIRNSSTYVATPESTGTAANLAPTNTATLANPDTVQETIDASLGFYYTLDRHWSFNLTYSYTMMNFTPLTGEDSFRQRIFLGASYQF